MVLLLVGVYNGSKSPEFENGLAACATKSDRDSERPLF
jgi:hypothetical protein